MKRKHYFRKNDQANNAMKTTIKKSLLFALLYYVVAVVACTKCHCPVIRDKFVNFTEIKLQNLQYSFMGDTNFSSAYNSIDTIPENSYGIALNVTSALVTKIKKKESFSLINTAMACDCATQYYTLKDSLQEIKIFSTKDFDTAHPAGSDITEYFVFFEKDYNANKIIQMPIDFSYKNFYILYDYNRGPEQTFFLNIPPESSREVQFELKMIFKSGKELSAISKAVFLE